MVEIYKVDLWHDFINEGHKVPHRSANVSSKYKYTCQITGVEKDLV